MRTGANQVRLFLVNLVEKEPVRFNVAVAKALPLSPERMVLALRWEWRPFGEQ